MMNNYIKMKRKGITPIIAIVLLLMMTVAAFGMTFVWVQKTQGEIQDGVSDEVTNMMGKNAAQFSIESVYNDSTGGLIAVIIRNSGTYSFSDGSQFKIYVDGLPTTHDNPAGSLAPGASQTYITTKSWDDIGGTNTHEIKVVSPQSTLATTTCVPARTVQGYC